MKKLEDHPELKSFVQSHHEMFNVADEQIKKTEAKLLEIAAPFKEDILRLQSVPGVGPIVALTTIAALSDVERFPSPKHVAS